MVDISVIIPTLNEEKYIGALISRLTNTNTCELEIFVCDAGSSDRTREIVLAFEHPNVHLRDNPKKYVSHAFNDTFPITKGKYIALLGAHASYPEHYFDYALTYLNNECDVVGGPLIQLGKSDTGKAIAAAMSSKFGVGGTEFRTEKRKMFVDSVAFAVYKREIFERIGLLDTSLIRNQDDELHYRMNAHHYKILMVPEMECSYYVRDSLNKLFSQYFQYGYYKPLVFAKVKSGIRIRHLVPSGFVAYLIICPILLLFSIWFLIPVLAYFMLAFTYSFRVYPVKPFLAFLAFLALHLSYGSGFILGLKNYFSYGK